MGRVETSREGPGGLSPEQSPREAPPKQPHSQRAASQLLFFFFSSEKGPIWLSLKFASHSQTRCPGSSERVSRLCSLTASFPGIPVRRARLCAVLWGGACLPEADSKKVSLGPPPEGHWRGRWPLPHLLEVGPGGESLGAVPRQSK